MRMDVNIIQKGLLCFHEKHGTNIRLSNDQHSAKRISGLNKEDAIVLSSQPMEMNTLYEVQVEQIQSEHLWPLQVGVTWVDPDTIELMPRCGEYLPRSVIITPHSICYSAKEIDDNYGSFLDDMKPGSRIGVRLDSARHLHVHFDNDDRGTAVSDVPHPCWAVFDVCQKSKKVSGIYLTKVEESKKWK